MRRLLERQQFLRALETSGLLVWRGDESALDVGSGAGEQSLLLAQRVARVVALDPYIEPRDALRTWKANGRGNITYRATTLAKLWDDSFDLIASYLGVYYADLARLPLILARTLRRGGSFFALCPRFWFHPGASLEPAERALQAYASLNPAVRVAFDVRLASSGLSVIETPPLNLPRVPVANVLRISGCVQAATPTGIERILTELKLDYAHPLPTTLLAVRFQNL
ncbi:MAG: methyltransferase domain-containing protein [Chloroflexi bacterium]|nr:methyltransferase domain-containing protein [Chloroflexota bacterium]